MTAPAINVRVEELTDRVEDLEGAVGAGVVTAGAGLTLTGVVLAVGANADGSVTVNANDIQVGILATDAQHGTRGGGTQHADVVTGGASGFMTGTQATKLSGIATGATAEVDADATHAGRVTLGAQTLGSGAKTVDSMVVTGALTVDATTLAVDATNNRVGIGTASPARTLVVRGSDTGQGIARLGNTHASGISALTLEDTTGANKLDLAFGQSTAALAPGKPYLRSYDADFRIYRDVSGSTSLQATLLNDGNVTLEDGGKLGLGIAPTFHLHASSTVAANGHVSARFQNLSSAGNSQFAAGNSSSSFAVLEIRGTTESTSNLPPVNYATFRGSTSSSGVAIQAQGSGTPIDFWTNNAGTHASRGTISSTGVLNIAAANGVTIGGVVVPTISSTSDLTNKTLTSPVMAGTWTGNVTLSGNLTLSGANTHSGLMTRSSGLKVKTRATSATTVTHATTDEVILASGGSGAVTVNLVTAIGNTGLRLTVVKSDAGANAVTLDGNSSETINGAATLALAAQFDRATIVSDGANWIRVD